MRINLLKLFVSCSLFLAPPLAQSLADLSASKSVTEVVKNEGLDLKSAAATSDAIVYELGCVRSL